MKRITFVKPSTPEDVTQQPQPTEASPQNDWSGLYDSIAFPHGKPQIEAAVDTEDAPLPVKCDRCGGELPDDEQGREVHASSIVHQLASGASSRAPAAINRKSKGLKMMEKYGYDPDERMGLGVQGEGLKKPIQVKERRNRAALGSKNEFAKWPQPKETPKVVKKTKGEKRAARREEEHLQSQKHGAWYNELFGK